MAEVGVVIFSVVVGGVMSLLGAALSNYYQFRSQQKERKRERLEERYGEIRHYLAICLQYADLISMPLAMGEDFKTCEAKEWLNLVKKQYDKWESLPASTSAVNLFVTDEEVLQNLDEIGKLRLDFLVNYRSFINGEGMINLNEKRAELIEIAKKVNLQLDELIDKV